MAAVACTFIVCAFAFAGFMFWLYRQPKVSAAEFKELSDRVSKLQQSVSGMVARTAVSR